VNNVRLRDQSHDIPVLVGQWRSSDLLQLEDSRHLGDQRVPLEGPDIRGHDLTYGPNMHFPQAALHAPPDLNLWTLDAGINRRDPPPRSVPKSDDSKREQS
jgi:hypothetical protein